MVAIKYDIFGLLEQGELRPKRTQRDQPRPLNAADLVLPGFADIHDQEPFAAAEAFFQLSDAVARDGGWTLASAIPISGR